MGLLVFCAAEGCWPGLMQHRVMHGGLCSAHVEHVVLFDFPRDPSEYVRRAGRTSRGAGNQGTVTILALGRQARNNFLVVSFRVL